jgi:signal transduction histidine kinase
MDQVTEFFKGLFETNLWPARWHCGTWSDFHGWLYIISDLMIWTAYFLIPVIILQYFLKKKESIKFQKVYILFAAFILLCGSTHLLDAIMFWFPLYRVNALVRFVTGVVSLFTVFHLIKILPGFFSQKTNMELEYEIGRRQEAEKKLEEANKNLEAFATVASHDLQEPLRKIQIYSSKLTQVNSGKLDDEGTKSLEKIVSSSKRMKEMITNVLTLSTIRDVALKDVNVNEAIDNAINDLEVKINEKNAIITVEKLPLIKGNEAYLTQLFMNIIGNAIKFSTRQPEIKITGSSNADEVEIKVSDNGIGMDEGDLDKIFTPFSRLHSKATFEGSGIGLAICKRIMDLHGGKIHVESKPDVGTTFFFTFQAT